MQRIRDASEQVADEIQRYVRDNELAPGDRIGTETDLAAWLGVSRPTIREAIRLLAGRHLVRAAKGPGGGIFVDSSPEGGMGRTLSTSIALMYETQSLHLEEMLEARRLLEVPMAGLAALRLDQAQIRVMREALEEEARAPDDEAVVQVADRRFHRALARSTGNRLLEAFIDWAYEVLQPTLIALVDPIISFTTLLNQHRAILDAIERGDSAEAENAMSEHLRYISDLFRSVEDTGAAAGAKPRSDRGHRLGPRPEKPPTQQGATEQDLRKALSRKAAPSDALSA